MAEASLLTQERSEISALLRGRLSEMTGNRWEDIREDSLLYSELNLTDFDLQRIAKELGQELEIDEEAVLDAVKDSGDGVTVSELVDVIMEEKELG